MTGPSGKSSFCFPGLRLGEALGFSANKMNCFPRDQSFTIYYYFIVTYGALDWFQSYLSNRQQCVRIGDAVFKVLPLEFGVPQGSILGPVLFTIYVNDLLSVPKRCLSASYVDDCKLYLSFSPDELTTSISALNEDLMRISQWCCKNSLLINPDKTKVLAVGVP